MATNELAMALIYLNRAHLQHAIRLPRRIMHAPLVCKLAFGMQREAPEAYRTFRVETNPPCRMMALPVVVPPAALCWHMPLLHASWPNAECVFLN